MKRTVERDGTGREESGGFNLIIYSFMIIIKAIHPSRARKCISGSAIRIECSGGVVSLVQGLETKQQLSRDDRPTYLKSTRLGFGICRQEAVRTED